VNYLTPPSPAQAKVASGAWVNSSEPFTPSFFRLTTTNGAAKPMTSKSRDGSAVLRLVSEAYSAISAESRSHRNGALAQVRDWEL